MTNKIITRELVKAEIDNVQDKYLEVLYRIIQALSAPDLVAVAPQGTIETSWQKLIKSPEPSFQRLMAMNPVTVATLPPETPTAGIYLFSEGDKHLYVGRTNRLRQRLQTHCRPSSGHNSATFAFRLAREKTGNLKASYKKEGSRSSLEDQPEFKSVFIEQKARVRKMDVRYVEEKDPMKQALLEMHVSTSLGTQYNDFDNH